MANSSKLRVMLSSKCRDNFPTGESTTLTDIRIALKKEIQSMEIAGKKAFDVWINEDAPPAGGSLDSWDVCIQAVKDCDILLVISNGSAGRVKSAGDIGICHAEMVTGLSIAPAKVRLIALEKIAITEDAEGICNKKFQEELGKQNLFRGGSVATVKELKARVKEALHDCVVALAQAGVRDAAKGKFHSGAALEWSRLDFGSRQKEMIGVLRNALLARTGSVDDVGKLIIKMDERDLLVELHAIPAALTVGPARELVGQPFLRDHQLADSLNVERGGPLHIIACQKTATESQAAKLLGFPDATLVAAPFGIFVADPIQKVQFAFLNNCRDEANTRHGLQRFMEWLSQTGEDKQLADRAQLRASIVRAIANVNPPRLRKGLSA
ncbi:hypothetical protein RGU70_16550 [Herbaspirillum sp. RTI4]|uniref:hypothetical protein n=1 Tax=Herbaspirillum sp. RTI4 TaxID=3048640 RepID=UPI002AB3B1BA|nr:hypothetical protein [Herbaspirillum sp. RTI4]MDY7579925.1 hypothetical protein [Herbaspirillum sp. RTI4]MEA9983318.1 hypothetical protein [Herbaspirillum sp. RTI4]